MVILSQEYQQIQNTYLRLHLWEYFMFGNIFIIDHFKNLSSITFITHKVVSDICGY